MIETLTPGPPALPPARLAAHLRLPEGAPELDATDELAALLAAAQAAVERRAGLALSPRTLRVEAEVRDGALTLGVHPVTAVTDVARDGETVTGWHRIGARLSGLPRGMVAVTFEAGFDPLPPDLAQAVLLLAAHWYERREAADAALAPLPLGVASLLAPFREVRP